MRLSGFGWVHSMNSLLRLCLCLVLVGLITAGAIGCTAPSSAGGKLLDVQVCKAEPLELIGGDSAQSSTGGKLPDIQVFKAEPLELTDGDSALYTFVVRRALKIQVIEAGNSIKEINNPTLATLKGTVKGLSAYAIQTGDSNTFNTILLASNGSGEVKEELTLSFANEPPPMPTSLIPPVSETKARSPQWGPQFSLPLPSTPSAKLGSEPEFFKCPSGCEYCLKPDDAAGRGFGQKCSEQSCYYSPDNQQRWYCYKPVPGWCCRDGKVNQTTRDECAQMGGYWSTNQNEAIQACQPMGYCCRDGNLYEATQSQCTQVGGVYYSNQAQAIERCQPPGYCCRDGQVYSSTQAQCAQIGGSYWSTNQAEAMRACQQTATCWCCSGGKVFQTTQAQCAQTGGTCYATQSQATAGCRQTTPTTPKTPNLR
ncbi:MAG: hypothetical protein MUO97_05545 [Dehalococcoidia bacterium]|nr:hypothetical protein [Dehalococcoidia bacterium]